MRCREKPVTLEAVCEWVKQYRVTTPPIGIGASAKVHASGYPIPGMGKDN
jgi:hypothetical protein